MRPLALAHQIDPHPGHFHVTSAKSGNVYVVTPTGGDGASCTCEFGRHAKAGGPVCSHVKAVREFAARVTVVSAAEDIARLNEVAAAAFARVLAEVCTCGAVASGHAHSTHPWCPALTPARECRCGLEIEGAGHVVDGETFCSSACYDRCAEASWVGR